MRVIIDAMGGDNAPEALVKGAVRAAKDGIEITLVGDEPRIREILAQEGAPEIRVVPSQTVIDNHESPTQAIREKKDSSLVVAFELLKNGEGDALVSAGSTGALLVGAIRFLGRIKGVLRPALAASLPTETGKVLLLDSGANTNCRPMNLLQFGIMGSEYVKNIWNVKSPNVKLLNIGAEEGKGDELAKESYALLKEADIHFGGNIEGRDILYGEADVIVADGFAGNIALKTAEGACLFLLKNIKQALMKTLKTKIGALLVKGGLSELKSKVNYENIGGAPLLGIDGAVIKAHGSSSDTAIYWAIMQANDFARTHLVDKIADGIRNAKKDENAEKNMVDNNESK